jgi:Sortilin, neurotensin receptor 3,
MNVTLQYGVLHPGLHLPDILFFQRCALHVHGYTERYDPRATFSTPSVPGLMMAVGNVGESLAPYTESDTFLSRDGGFTWEEVHKDAHLWEFGDSGSILVMVNDEEATDNVLFSTDEGISWREYKFTSEKIRIRSIVTVPEDTSRRFILMGSYPRSSTSVVIHIDFTSLTRKTCGSMLYLCIYVSLTSLTPRCLEC